MVGAQPLSHRNHPVGFHHPTSGYPGGGTRILSGSTSGQSPYAHYPANAGYRNIHSRSQNALHQLPQDKAGGGVRASGVFDPRIYNPHLPQPTFPIPPTGRRGDAGVVNGESTVGVKPRQPLMISTRVPSTYGFSSPTSARERRSPSPFHDYRQSVALVSPGVLVPGNAHVSPKSSPLRQRRQSAGGAIILKEGYLNRKTDLNPLNSVSTALLARGWKVYRVLLKGSKLYFYKPPSEGDLRKQFPFEGSPLSTVGPRMLIPEPETPTGDDCRGLVLNMGEFDPTTSPLIFQADVQDGTITAPLSTRYVFGGIFTEVDIFNFKFKRHVSLLVFDDVVVVCKRKWVKQHKGMVGAVSNVFRLARSMSTRSKESDTHSLRSVEVLSRKKTGYFTKWKLHASYPLSSVDIVEAASTRLSISTSALGAAPAVPGNRATTLYSHANISSTSVMTTNSMMSTDFSSVVSSGNVQAFQMFVAKGKQSTTRLFVAESANDKAVWVARFMAAKAAFGRRLRQQHSYVMSSKRSNISSTYASTFHSSVAAPGPCNSEPTAQNRRRRLYWSTERHPELILMNPKARGRWSLLRGPVIAGTKTALVHELLFHTPDSSAHEQVDFDTYLMAFLCTYPCFMTPLEFVKELERYTELISSAEETGTQFLQNFGLVLTRWIQWAPEDLTSELLDIVMKLVAKLIVPINMTLATQIKSELSTMLKQQEKVGKRDKSKNINRPSHETKGAGTSDLKSTHGKSTIKFLEDPRITKEQSSLSTAGNRLKSPRLLGKRNAHNSLRVLGNKGGQTTPGSKATSDAPPSLQLATSGLTPTLFLKMDPMELALQLYLYHWQLFFAHNPLQFRQFIAGNGEIGGSLTSGNTGISPVKNEGGLEAQPVIPVAHALHFTHSQPHFLVRLIHCHVLVDLPLTRNSKRGAVLTHWIRVGEAARYLQDAPTWVAIATALTSPSIVRLRETWNDVSVDLRKIIQQEWVPILLQHCLLACEAAQPPTKPQLLVVQSTHSPKEGAIVTHPLPSIPYCGTIHHSLAYLNRTEPSTLSAEEVLKCTTQRLTADANHAAFVNMGKYWAMYEVVWRALRDAPVQQPRSSRPSSATLSRSSSRASINQRASTSSTTTASRVTRKPSMVGALANSLKGSTSSAPSALAALAHHLSPGQDSDPLQPIVTYQDYFASLNAMEDASPHYTLVNEYDPKHLFQLGVLCEPLSSDHYLDHHGPASNNLEAVVSPLACPDIVVSSRLTHFMAVQGRLDMIGFRICHDVTYRPRTSNVHTGSVFLTDGTTGAGMGNSGISSGHHGSTTVGSAAAAAAAAAIRPLTGFGLSSIFASVDSHFFSGNHQAQNQGPQHSSVRTASGEQLGTVNNNPMALSTSSPKPTIVGQPSVFTLKGKNASAEHLGHSGPSTASMVGQSTIRSETFPTQPASVRMTKIRSNTTSQSQVVHKSPSLSGTLLRMSPSKVTLGNRTESTMGNTLEHSAAPRTLKKKRSVSFPTPPSASLGSVQSPPDVSSNLAHHRESKGGSDSQGRSATPAVESDLDVPAVHASPMERTKSDDEVINGSGSIPQGRPVQGMHAADLPAGAVLSVVAKDLMLRIQHFKSKTFRTPDGRTSSREELMVAIHAGTVERLVDVLVHGVRQFQKQLLTTDLPEQPVMLRGELLLDYSQYQRSFFVTYRSFAKGSEVLHLLERYYKEAAIYVRRLVTLARENGEGPPSAVSTAPVVEAVTRVSPLSKSEEGVVHDVRQRILNLCDYWITHFSADFLNSTVLTEDMVSFLQTISSDPPFDSIKENSLTPTHVKERLLRNSIQVGIPTIFKEGGTAFSGETSDATGDQPVLSRIPTVDLLPFSAGVLLECFNVEAARLFAQCELQDWLVTFGLLELQTVDMLAWFPSRRAPIPAEEDIVVTDILVALDRVKRHIPNASATTGPTPAPVGLHGTPPVEHLLTKMLPHSVQHLIFYYRNLRQFVISHFSGSDLDLETRVQHLLLWLEVLRVSRVDAARGAINYLRDSLTTNLNCNIALTTGPLSVERYHVPSFVEHAVASALVSPESRAFSKAWTEVVALTGINVDTMESALRFEGSYLQPASGISGTTVATSIGNSKFGCSTSVGKDTSSRLVPSLAWIFQNMIEMCYDTHDQVVGNEQLVYYEKRRRIMALLMVCERLSSPAAPPRLKHSERALPNFAFLRVFADLPSTPLNRVLIVATNENTHQHAYHPTTYAGNISGKLVRPFHKLVSEELERIRREGKDREKLVKEQREQAQSQQRRDQERDRQLKKQLKESQQRQAKNEQLLKMSSLLHTASATPDEPGSSGLRRMPSVKAALVINLINSTTDVEHSYTKRDHVFRIITEEGGQYLLQASSKEEMLDWIKCIHEAAKEAAARRLTVFVQDAKRKAHAKAPSMTSAIPTRGSVMLEIVNEEGGDLFQTPAPPSGTTNDIDSTDHLVETVVEPKAFGIDLAKLMKDGRIPRFVERCLVEVESRGLEEVGIYRVPGSVAGINNLKRAFNAGDWEVPLTSDECSDINVVAGALKLFLRELPEPLLTFQLYDGFIHAATVDDYNERLWAIKDLIHALPKPNYTLLKRLVEHLERVTDFEEVNHMYSSNLAIVFGPTLMKPRPGPNSFGASMSNLGHHQNIVRNLILQYHWIFDIEEEAEVIPEEEEGEEDPAIEVAEADAAPLGSSPKDRNAEVPSSRKNGDSNLPNTASVLGPVPVPQSDVVMEDSQGVIRTSHDSFLDKTKGSRLKEPPQPLKLRTLQESPPPTLATPALASANLEDQLLGMVGKWTTDDPS
ncbi:hypothetical protein IWQ61_006371 [Dispira simplex]|nr:hypothetical protein IWQ61_006371 [Dispira simplex]